MKKVEKKKDKVRTDKKIRISTSVRSFSLQCIEKKSACNGKDTIFSNLNEW